ncbi:YeeE/YedE family protein [Candidatus Chloroploca sp. M-50]|uniref:YeeE/YedE family protein n=1 Tax=Candidatus Chloroploca mongolica TaxID=2528176 RepID=A0ABS4DF01_9CHLR|nr:YeeE/YedE family protein [Candidatus Chloroploca mongolica]MBP1468034.1 YeeE/YedE family protein [Candidatus Chloroploca mongolica]
MTELPSTRADRQPFQRLARTTGVRLGLAVALLIGLTSTAYWLHATPGRGATAALSLLLGASLGFVFQRGRFCYFCILRDWIEFRNTGPVYAILAALAAGSIGYTLVFGIFLPNPFSGRLPPEAHIGPVSWVLAAGGLAFGLGMALSGACVSGHLYRLGEGSTRAPVALLGVLAGFGLGFLSWNQLYLATIADAPVIWLPARLGYGGALFLQLVLLGGIAFLLLRNVPELPPRPAQRFDLAGVWAVLFHQRWPALVTGALVGLLGTVAYMRIEPLGVTSQLGSLARTGMDQVGLLPTTLFGLDRLAGCATQVVQTITANGLLISGLVLGSLTAALLANRFQPDRLTMRGAGSALVGGILQGWGAMVALGCTVGTLLSGISAFAVSGWLFGLTMLAGVWLGIRSSLHRLV